MKFNPKPHSQVLQNVSDRVGKAYQNFFRRVKERKKGKNIKPGYPRFKKVGQVKSFTYPQSGYKIVDNKLSLSKIGHVNIKIGRKQNRIEGEVKTLCIKRMPSGKWYALFSCEIEVDVPQREAKKRIGIDVGLEHLANLSNGSVVENNRFLIKHEKRLKKLSRRLSRKKKRSKRRTKAQHQLAVIHETITNSRHNHLHQTSRKIINEYDRIVVEDLNIKNMVRHPYLAKYIHDASWGTLIQFLDYKAESAGCQVVKVNPRGTSQECHQCGHTVLKTLAQRWHRCSYCGIELHRDINAAKVVLKRDIHTPGTGEIYAQEDGSSALVHNELEFSSSMN